MNKRICIYPGSFDPITLGHLDIIQRGSKIFDQLIVAVVRNPGKNEGWIPIPQRKELVKACCGHLKNVQIESFEGLLIDYVKQKEAAVVLKGLRAVTDFENEFQMAQLNHQMAPEIETLFMMTAPEYAYISSSAVREIAFLQGDVTQLVPQKALGTIIDYAKTTQSDKTQKR